MRYALFACGAMFWPLKPSLHGKGLSCDVMDILSLK
jgi:hypothetical protein